jgi:hypothetical protein
VSKKRIVIEKYVTCKQGVITYRLPTASEVFGILSEMKLDLNTITGKDGGGVDANVALLLMSKALDALDPFIVSVDVELDGEKHTDVEFVLSHPAFITPLSQIAAEFMALMQGDTPKKSELETL